MTRSEMIARLVFAMGGRSAEELVFHEPTTGASTRHRPGHQDRPGDGHRVRHERPARRRALRPRAGRPVPRPLDGQPGRLLARGRPRDRRGGARAHRGRAHRGVGDPQHLPRRARRPGLRAAGEGDADPHRPGADLRPGGEAAADHRVQRLRRAHAVGQAADQDPGRAGPASAASRGRRTPSRRREPTPGRLLPGWRQRRAGARPERRPAAARPAPPGRLPGGRPPYPAAPVTRPAHVPGRRADRRSAGHAGARPDQRPGRSRNSVPHNYGAPPDWRPATTPAGPDLAAARPDRRSRPGRRSGRRGPAAGRQPPTAGGPARQQRPSASPPAGDSRSAGRRGSGRATAPRRARPPVGTCVAAGAPGARAGVDRPGPRPRCASC